MDFNQGRITTIHDFDMEFDNLKSRLAELKGKYPAGVIIPLHENDLKNSQFSKIVSGLNKCDYLKKVFIALSASSNENYEAAIKLASNFRVSTEVLWCNKPDVNLILTELKHKGLDVTKSCGKGKDLSRIEGTG